MFKLFKKSSEVDKLMKKHELLLKKAFDLSKTNRKESDRLYAEADIISKKIQQLENQ